MTEYLMRFRFAHIDDHHAQHLAAAIAGGTVAEWDGNGLVWDGVERADGRPFQPEPAPEVDPVLISAAWGGAARPVVSDEDMEKVITRIAAVLQARDAPDDPGTETASPQASSGVPEWLRQGVWDLSIPDHRRVHAEQRPVRPTASTVTDDQLDALHAENARLRAELDGRPIQVLVDEGIQQLRGELNATRTDRDRYAATLREILDTFDLGYGPGDVFAGASSPPIAPEDFNRWRAALGLPPVDTAPFYAAPAAGNAEDCPRCAGADLPCPWACPGYPDTRGRQ